MGLQSWSEARPHTQLSDGCQCLDSGAMIVLLGLKSLLLALVLPSFVSGGKEETTALLYLSKYGYIPKNANTEALVTEDNIKEYIKDAVKDFQEFAGLDVTGEMDPVTVELMSTPGAGSATRGGVTSPESTWARAGPMCCRGAGGKSSSCLTGF